MTVKVLKIGNSKGIILPKQIMKMCAIHEEVNISVENNHVIISPAVNPRATWEVQFKEAIAKGHEPENDFTNSMENDFDKNEWTW